VRKVSRRDLLSLSSPAADDADPLVHIVSLLVQATPNGCAAVRSAVAQMPAAELHETHQANKLALVLESADSRAIAEATSELQQLSGVLTVSIVAHLVERASLLEESNEPTTVPAA
jgi:nitrate reductase NapD